MKIQPADRLSLVQEYYFSRKLKEVAKLNAEGQDIISLAIGSPDMPPSKQTIDKLCEVASKPEAHGYQPTMGTPELREAMAGFYKRWYDVDVDPKTEVQPLIGSKEGILHVTLAFVNPGEQVLVPNPGYPTYTSLSKILGAEIVNYNLREDNGWQPDFDELEKMDLSRVRLMWTNYPNMPTGGNARREFFAVFILLGNLSPKEHSHLIGIERTSEFGHYLLGYVTTTTVGGDVSLAVPFGSVGIVSLGSCELYSTERTRVDVALYLQYPRDESGV